MQWQILFELRKLSLQKYIQKKLCGLTFPVKKELLFIPQPYNVQHYIATKLLSPHSIYTTFILMPLFYYAIHSYFFSILVLTFIRQLHFMYKIRLDNTSKYVHLSVSLRNCYGAEGFNDVRDNV